MLEKGSAAPQQPGVVRDRHDRRSAVYGEPRSAGMIRALLAGPYPGSLRKDGDPESLRKTLPTQLRHSPECAGSAAAVDGDRTCEREPAPEKRDPQQLALQHPHLGRENHLEGEGLPRRLMLGQDDRGGPRKVLRADYTVSNAEH